MNEQQAHAIAHTCRESLLAYSKLTNRNYTIQPHHRVIAETLERVERGELRKVMFFCPPRYGKSEEVSINFPAWYLGRNPGNEIILCSYSSDLSSQFARKARNLYTSDEHKFVFDARIAQDSQAVGHWHTDI